MNAIETLVNALESDNIETAKEAFESAMRERVNTSFEIKKIALTSQIFDKDK
jgi:PBP1b-binding outer membrane lipoprotein LpoB